MPNQVSEQVELESGDGISGLCYLCAECASEMLWLSCVLLEAGGVLYSVCFVARHCLPGNSLEARMAHAAH